MTQHPTPEALAAWLHAELPAEEGKAVLLHLLEACPRCCRAVREGWPVALPATDLDEGQLAVYDFPVLRAIRGVVRQVEANEREEETAMGDLAALVHTGAPPVRRQPVDRGGPAGWAWCEEFLEASRDRLRESPREAVELAALAVSVAEVRLEESRFPPGQLTDLRARARAELGNARRAADDLAGAESDLATAAELAMAGTGSPRLQARILDLSASLYRDQRQFEEATRCLDRAFALCRRHGEEHLAGRALISKGLILSVNQDYMGALQLLEQGLALIDQDREPHLTFSAVHSTIDCLVKAGFFAAADKLLAASAPLYEEHAGAIDDLKRCWVEGLIAAGLGAPERAEEAFRAARAGFAREGKVYDAALATLDLAAVYLRQGRLGEVGRLASEMLVTFRALRIRREAIAAVLLVEEAVRTERLTLALLQDVAREFQRLEA